MTDQPQPAPDQPAAPWPYATQPARAPEGLAIASAVIAVAWTAVEIATALAAGPAEADFIEAMHSGGSPYDTFTLYDGLETLLFPVMLAAYVVSCLWLHLARKSAKVIRPGHPHQRSTVWVWLGWWVPIVSFWFPFQVVRDVRDSSRQGSKAIGLGLWWTAWLVYILGNRLTARLSTSTDPANIELLSAFEAVTAVAVVVGCVQWCRILHRITVDQQTALTPR